MATLIRIILTCRFCQRRGSLPKDVSPQDIPNVFFVGCSSCKRNIQVDITQLGSGQGYFLDDGSSSYPYVWVGIYPITT